MGFSSMVNRIPYKISGRSAASSGLYTPSNSQYDYALGGIPFLSATGDQRPDLEKPVPQRKDQFDANKDPGEYSLNQWWLRSQTSFIGGAGIVYQDPDTQGTSKNIRFARSVGVDPFSDSDFLTLLKETEQCTAIGGANSGQPYVASQVNSIGDVVYVARGATIETRVVTANNLTINATATLATSSAAQAITGYIVPFQDVSVTPTQAFVTAFMADSGSAANSGVWRVNAGAAVATRIYQPPANMNFITMAKARGFLVVGTQNSLYNLDPYVGVPTAWPAAVAAVPKDQTIVAITDGPDAVYVAANSPTQGYIYKSTFSNLGIINGLTLTATLPYGELLNDCQTYVNTYMVITTTQGIRVGAFSTSVNGSSLSYGPNILPVTETLPVPASGINGSGFGRIAFSKTLALICTIGTPQSDAARGLVAVDLATLINDQNTGATFNAYASWNYFPNNIASLVDVAITQYGRPVFTTFNGSNAKVFIEHQTSLIDSGYLDTGRCRFNTLEPKLFKYVSIRTPTPLSGDLTVTLLDDTGGSTTYLTYGASLDPGTGDIATPSPGGPRNWEAFRFTLHRNLVTPALGAKLDSWQIKALPGTLKQRMITRQFLCFNSEQDKTGQRVSGDTQSVDKLTAVRQMCQRGDTVTLQDLVQNVATQVIIDDYQFTMMTTPGPNKENYGGYLTVVMRTVADAVPDVTPVMVEGD